MFPTATPHSTYVYTTYVYTKYVYTTGQSLTRLQVGATYVCVRNAASCVLELRHVLHSYLLTL